MEDSKRRVILGEYKLENTSDPNYPGTYVNDPEDCEWSQEKFERNFKVVIKSLDKLEMEFDLIGINCAMANAIRRILIAEVPSMAIEKVFVHNNTSVVKDEVLAHRLGLVPLKADARFFEYRSDASTEASANDTLEFELKIKCTVNNEGPKNSHKIDDLYKNHSVYSGDIKWIPLFDQANILKEKDVGPVHTTKFDVNLIDNLKSGEKLDSKIKGCNILLDKLRPGQELDLKLHAVKGIGKDHAKFSPVATAHYRMHPDIRLLKEVKGEAAERLQKCFPPGVIKLKEENGEKKAVVSKEHMRYDNCSRIVFRHDDLKDCVEMARIRDHFIFNIESVGALPPDVLFLEAVKVLGNKCRMYLDELEHDTIVRARY